MSSDLLVTFKCFAKRAQSVDCEIGTGVWRNSSIPQAAVILLTSVQLFNGMTVSLSPGWKVTPVPSRPKVTIPVDRDGSESMKERESILALNLHSSNDPRSSCGWRVTFPRKGSKRSLIDSESVLWTSSQGRPALSDDPAFPFVSLRPVFATTSKKP